MTTRFECCGTMKALSSTDDDWEEISSQLKEMGEKLSAPTLLVHYLPELKCYAIDNVAIYFCPWCAAVLPEPQIPKDAVEYDFRQ